MTSALRDPEYSSEGVKLILEDPLADYVWFESAEVVNLTTGVTVLMELMALHLSMTHRIIQLLPIFQEIRITMEIPLEGMSAKL